MKKIVYSLFGLLLTLAGCVQDDFVLPEPTAPEEGSEVTIRFSANIPEFKTIQTRAANGGVNDMWIVLFDQNGTFLTRREATLINQTETGGEFSVTLPQSIQKRIVHFICNYDWGTFNDDAAIGANEATVVALMNTDRLTFWTRHEVIGGFSNTTFSAPNEVKLLRNQAKISVTSTAKNFILRGFTIHNAPEKGTVAPFNATDEIFQERAITEPVNMKLNAAKESEISETERYLFERKNKIASAITTVIVKGTYEGKEYFYKIDLIDSDAADKARYNIERNYHYKVTIRTVSKEGYSSFSDALEGASHNNTALDPIIEKYPILSDGTSKLEGEKTLVVFTHPGQTLSVGANFFDTLTATTPNNSGMTATLVENNGVLEEGSVSYDAATGRVTAKVTSSMPSEPSEAKIVVSKNGLSRIIRVLLREPFSFNDVRINDNTPALLEGGQNQKATLRFTIPEDFPTDLYPLPIKIYTQGLYPAETGLQMFVENGVVHYVYMLTPDKLDDLRRITIEFKTNKSGNAETVTLKADYFIDGTVNYDTQYSGKITYGTAKTPFPAGEALFATVGSVQMNFEGKYAYLPPANPNMDTEVTLYYDTPINTGFSERYSVTTTIGALYNGENLHMPLHYVFTGKIEHGSYTLFGWNGSNVPKNGNVRITDGPGEFEMIEDGSYRLTVPASTPDATNITITYTDNSGWWRIDRRQTQSIGTLKNNADWRLQ